MLERRRRRSLHRGFHCTSAMNIVRGYSASIRSFYINTLENALKVSATWQGFNSIANVKFTSSINVFFSKWYNVHLQNMVVSFLVSSLFLDLGITGRPAFIL